MLSCLPIFLFFKVHLNKSDFLIPCIFFFFLITNEDNTNVDVNKKKTKKHTNSISGKTKIIQGLQLLSNLEYSCNNKKQAF